jgi:cytochrome c oxidase subunit 2
MALSVANLSEDDIPGLATLITTELPPTQPTSTIAGDAARGEDYYINICSACHGGNALGNDLLGAPALAGVSDWYLKSSYQGYLEGTRGHHPDDSYGAQMARLAPALARGGDINDVIAYIATLPPRRAP